MLTEALLNDIAEMVEVAEWTRNTIESTNGQPQPHCDGDCDFDNVYNINSNNNNNHDSSVSSTRPQKVKNDMTTIEKTVKRTTKTKTTPAQKTRLSMYHAKYLRLRSTTRRFLVDSAALTRPLD